MRDTWVVVAIASLILFAAVAGRLRGEQPRWQRRSDPVTLRIVGGAVLAVIAVITLGKLLS